MDHFKVCGKETKSFQLKRATDRSRTIFLPFSFETSLTVCPIVLDTDAALELPEVAAVDVDADAGADADGVNNSLKASGMLPETKSANSGAGVVDRVCSCGGSR